MLIMHPTSYGEPTVHGNENTIRVGKYCSIANSAVFDGGIGHNHRAVTSYPLWRLGYCEEVKAGKCKGDINIGNDVWIGDGALIMSGVTIGDGAVIAARAVVTHDVGPYEIWGGVPAKGINYRYGTENRMRYVNVPRYVECLLALKWWDWPTERIRANAHLLLSENIEEFLNQNEGK
jgi:acetyltransferase-like isoleucine patch superfamily enzyme